LVKTNFAVKKQTVENAQESELQVWKRTKMKFRIPEYGTVLEYETGTRKI